MSTRPPDIGPLFADNASIDAIRWHLDLYRQKLARTAANIGWLEELKAIREAQVAAGTWPTTDPDPAARTCPHCEAKKRPHQSRDNGPTCTWCGRPAMDPIHDPRQGRVRGAEAVAAS